MSTAAEVHVEPTPEGGVRLIALGKDGRRMDLLFEPLAALEMADRVTQVAERPLARRP